MDSKDTMIRIKKEFKNAKFNNPIMIAGFPGIGNVGKLVVEHLRFHFKPVRIATIYSKYFPDVALMTNNGTFKLAAYRFYLLRDKSLKNDIIILTGDAQPSTAEGRYIIGRKIVKFFKERLNGKVIYTIAGYGVGRELEKTPIIYANATSKKVIERLKGYGIQPGKTGIIFGSAAVLPAFAKIEGLDGACIMGETISTLAVDAIASKAVLKVLAKMLSLKMDMKDIDSMIEETAKALKEQEKIEPQEVTYPDLEKSPSYIR